MKQFVCFLLIFGILMLSGSLYTEKGEFVGVRESLKGGLDFVMFIPNKAKSLYYSLSGSAFNVPSVIDTTIDCDFYVRYMVEDTVYVLYLEVTGFEEAPFNTLFGAWFYMSRGQPHATHDRWKCCIVANSWDDKWVGASMNFCADGLRTNSTYHTILDPEPLGIVDSYCVFPDGERYKLECDSVVLPYEKHGGR